MSTQPSDSDIQEAVDKIADANIPHDPDFVSKFLKKGTYPSFFRGIFVQRITTDTDG